MTVLPTGGQGVAGWDLNVGFQSLPPSVTGHKGQLSGHAAHSRGPSGLSFAGSADGGG